MKISAIAAMSNNRVIGVGSQIPWHLPDDFKWFKKHTLNRHIIMGRKTFESIGRPLPKRTNVVITRDMFYAASGCMITHSISEAIELAEVNGEEEVFICGGGTIYEQSKHLWDKVYLTKVNLEVEGGTAFFPEFLNEEWKQTFKEHHPTNKTHKSDFVFEIYEKQI